MHWKPRLELYLSGSGQCKWENLVNTAANVGLKKMQEISLVAFRILSLTVFCKCPVCIVVGLSVCVLLLCLCVVLNVLVFAQLPGGWLDVRTRKVLRPATSTQVFLLVSLCLKANAEMVPNFPSCHYMLLMWPSLSKFVISVRKYV
jgi:uncharacterized membrane protein